MDARLFQGLLARTLIDCSKARFYQALLVKWQRKLGCPKPDEGFHDLLGRARMLEEHEKQFTASALTRGEVRKGSNGGSRKKAPDKSSNKQGGTPAANKSPTDSEVAPSRERRCYKWSFVQGLRIEAPGHSTVGTVNVAKLSDRAN